MVRVPHSQQDSSGFMHPTSSRIVVLICYPLIIAPIHVIFVDHGDDLKIISIALYV
jgi:hypothetical protein